MFGKSYLSIYPCLVLACAVVGIKTLIEASKSLPVLALGIHPVMDAIYGILGPSPDDYIILFNERKNPDQSHMNQTWQKLGKSNVESQLGDMAKIVLLKMSRNTH